MLSSRGRRESPVGLLWFDGHAQVFAIPGGERLGVARFETSMFSIPLMVSEAFLMLVITAQIAALDPLMVICVSTIMVCLLGSSDGL